VITHDRAFLDRVVNRIVELTAGSSVFPAICGLRDAQSDQLANEALRGAKFDKFWASGRVWDPQGHRGAPYPQRGPRGAGSSDCASSAASGASASAR